jgi:hypothetical protein
MSDEIKPEPDIVFEEVNPNTEQSRVLAAGCTLLLNQALPNDLAGQMAAILRLFSTYLSVALNVADDEQVGTIKTSFVEMMEDLVRQVNNWERGKTKKSPEAFFSLPDDGKIH